MLWGKRRFDSVIAAGASPLIFSNGEKGKHMELKDRINFGQLLTVAGALVTLAASIITSEQQKQANHEIAKEVADILRADMKKGEF